MSESKNQKGKGMRWMILAVGYALSSLMPFGASAQALHLQPSYNETAQRDAWPHADQIIADAKSRAKERANAGYVWAGGRDTYKTTLGSDVEYITLNHYLVLTSEELESITDTSRKLYPGECAAYIYDSDQAFESSYVLKVGDGHAGTNCNTVLGVSGVAYRGKPALLVIAQYFYTDKPAVGSISGIGSNWIQTAVLLPIVQKPDGTWTFTQNTTCFARTNTYKTLAKARKHLERNCH